MSYHNQVASWEGSGVELAAALQKVSGTPTKFSLAMPRFFRGASYYFHMHTFIKYQIYIHTYIHTYSGLFLNDLHHMCLYFEKHGGFTASIDQFKEVTLRIYMYPCLFVSIYVCLIQSIICEIQRMTMPHRFLIVHMYTW